MVCHNYLPVHSAGTEVYTAQLAARLSGRGHEVSVFAAEKDISRADLSLCEREHEGIPVIEVINNLYHSSFRETWDHPGIAAVFGQTLDRLRPEVVHFQHLLYLSIGCVEEAARRGLGVVFTLHDYWLHCPRFGQRVHADGSLCPTIDLGRCGGCLADFKHSQTTLERTTGRAIAGVRGVTGIDLSGAARSAARAISRTGGGAGPPARAAAQKTAEVIERDRAVRERVLPHVHRFVSPSLFLRERFAEWGLPAERVEHLPTGLDPAAFRAAGRPPRAAGDPLRVLFVGSLVPQKGPHLLLEAWGRLAPELRARGRLELVGSARHHPDYQKRLRELAGEVGAHLRGAVSREEIPDILRAADLVVVPSTWYENAPMVILEARAVGTPLLVSDAGGMRELVQEGRGGLHFRLGDAGDLADRLRRVLAAPALLDGLGTGAPVPSLDENTAAIERLYRAALREGAGIP